MNKPNLFVVCAFLSSIASITLADEFDNLSGKRLVELVNQADATVHPELELRELGNLPFVLPGVRSVLLVAKTESGNYCKMLVSPGRRKGAEPGTGDVPIVFLERFETFDGGNLATRLAKGKNLVLFDGFKADLDAGLIVPDGQGGDLMFKVDGDKPRIASVAPATVWSLTKPITVEKNIGVKLSPGRAIVASDYSGKYKLFADGQWSGSLQLELQDGAVKGAFQSDLNGTSYPVEGEVSVDGLKQVHLVISYPRTKQEFTGSLFADGKGAIAGTGTMLGRTFGFFAIRDGGRLAPSDVEDSDVKEPLLFELELTKLGLFFDKNQVNPETLPTLLTPIFESRPETIVQLGVANDVPFELLDTVLSRLKTIGVGAIRIKMLPKP